jgi:hypothetical protein
MSDVTAALNLLDGLAFRDRITEEERIPAWRAIKTLYRAGVPEEYCEHLVKGIRSLSKPHACGPTLKYHLDGIKLMLARKGGEA